MKKYFFSPPIDQAIWLLWIMLGIVWALVSWWLDMRKGVVPVIVITVAYFGYFIFLRAPALRFAKPLVALSEKEVSFRNPFNISATIDCIPLQDIKIIEVVGLIDRRYIRCTFTDKSYRDIGPFSFNHATEAKLVGWLKNELPQPIQVYQRDIPSFFETIRGDY